MRCCARTAENWRGEAGSAGEGMRLFLSDFEREGERKTSSKLNFYLDGDAAGRGGRGGGGATRARGHRGNASEGDGGTHFDARGGGRRGEEGMELRREESKE